MSRNILLILAAAMAAISGCGGPEKKIEQPMRQPVIEKLLSQQQLQRTGLTTVWQENVPLKTHEKISRLVVLDDRLYALSDKNYLVSFERKTGKRLFSRMLGLEGFSVLELKHYGRSLYTIAGDKLMEIDRDTGEDKKAKSFDYGVVCSAGRNKMYFYIGGSDRRAHCIKADTGVEVFEVAAESDTPIRAIDAGETDMIFATQAGDVISILPMQPTKRWSFKAAAGIVEPVVRNGGDLFFASNDTCVYAIDAGSGEFKWKYRAGAVLDKSPAVTEDAVFQNIGERGFLAIDKTSGKLLWHLENGKDLLAESETKEYVFSRNGSLTVMDKTSGKSISDVDLPLIRDYAINCIDSFIYITDGEGRIACLRPTKKGE
jgi:outer membrane protein assembly factor BamB